MVRVFMMIFPLLLAIGQMVCAAPTDSANPAPAEVKALRVGNDADRLRLVVDTDKEVDYDTMVLKNPGRIVVNLHNARLSAEVERDRALTSAFASRVRVGQFTPTTVRIVVETEEGKGGFDVFSLEGGASPYRVVIDIGRLLSKEKGNTSGSPLPASPSEAGTSTDGADGGKAEDNPGTTESESQGTMVPDKPDGQQGEKEAEASEDQPLQGGQTQADKENRKGTENKKKTEDKEQVPIELPEIDLEEVVLSEKVKGKKIALDPGHGGEDPGAIGPTGVTEKSITLRIALVAKQLLEEAGAKVIMTRTTDTEVSPKHRQATDIEELQARCDVANKAGADVFVSIHMDSFASRKAAGTTGYYYEKGTAVSKKLAAIIQAAILKEIRTESRGVKSCNFYVVRHTKMPATLIEVAFVSNPREEQLLDSEQGIQHAAVGLATGIANFFGK